MTSLKKRKRINVGALATYTVLSIASFIELFPSLWAILTSLKRNEDVFKLPITYIPNPVTLMNYPKVFVELPQIGMYFMNSVIYSVGTVVGLWIVGSLAGYAFGRLDFKGKSLGIALIITFMAIPGIVYLLPIYIMELRWGITDTHLGVFLPFFIVQIPFSIFVMRGSFRALPSELEESAKIDGASLFQIYRHVYLPLVTPGLITVGIFSFLSVWNSLLYPLILTQREIARPITLGIYALQGEIQDYRWGTYAAGMVISALPCVLVFLLLQNYFIGGLTKGAIKG